MMNKQVLWAGAVVGLLAALAACKKDEPAPNTANNFGQPGYTQPGYAQPGQPGYTQPGYTQPGYTQPGTTQPGYTQPTGTTPPANTTTGQPAQGDLMGTLGGMVGGVLGGLGTQGTGGTATGGTDVISLGIQHNASQNAPGMKVDGQMVRLQLQQGQTSEAQIQLQPGKCYTLVAASMPGVIEVAIKATMPSPLQQQVLGQNDAGPNPMPVVWGGGNCYKNPAPLAMPVRLEVTMKQGAGQIGIQPYSK